MSLSDLAYASLEQAINQHISLDPKAQAEIVRLHGKVIALEIQGISLTIYMIPGVEQIQLFGSHEDEPDCLLQGSPMTIARLRNKIPEGEAAIPLEMRVSGDVELAEEFCRILRQVEIDWEAHLSKYTGSLIAGELSKAINFAGYWRDHIADTLKQDMQDLLQHEASVLPTRHEIAGFISDVEQLTERLEHLQKRVDAVEGKKSSKGATN